MFTITINLTNHSAQDFLRIPKYKTMDQPKGIIIRRSPDVFPSQKSLIEGLGF
jgi:hypothetical protein